MIVKVKDKEYSFDGYAQPLQSIQQLAEECYQQGRADAFREMIDKCKKHSYICHSSEFADVLEEWMNDKGAEEELKIDKGDTNSK